MWEGGIKKGEVSRLSGAESIAGQCGKLESYALLNRKPTEIFKNTCVSWESMTGNHLKSTMLLTAKLFSVTLIKHLSTVK